MMSPTFKLLLVLVVVAIVSSETALRGSPVTLTRGLASSSLSKKKSGDSKSNGEVEILDVDDMKNGKEGEAALFVKGNHTQWSNVQRAKNQKSHILWERWESY